MKGFTVSRAIPVEHSKDEVLKFIWNISNLQEYEPKVDAVQLEALDDTHGIYSAQGHFGFAPWEGRFSYRKTKDGFISDSLEPISGTVISGGFVVKQNEDKSGTTLRHWEHYELPQWLRPLTPILKLYFGSSMKRELKNISGLLDHKR